MCIQHSVFAVLLNTTNSLAHLHCLLLFSLLRVITVFPNIINHLALSVRFDRKFQLFQIPYTFFESVLKVLHNNR